MGTKVLRDFSLWKYATADTRLPSPCKVLKGGGRPGDAKESVSGPHGCGRRRKMLKTIPQQLTFYLAAIDPNFSPIQLNRLLECGSIAVS